MPRSRSVAIGLLLITLLFGANTGCTLEVSAAGPQPGNVDPRDTDEVQVALTAAHSTTSWDGRLDQVARFELPVLYLHRGRDAAARDERTLAIHVSRALAGEVESRSRLSRDM